MTARRVHRERMLRDDIFWLETRIQQLQSAGDNRDRRLAECYRNLLRQRHTQLESRPCPGAWQEYFA